MSTLTIPQIDAIIAAKYIIISGLCAQLQDLLENPQVSYSIDNETWNFNEWQKWLVDAQAKEWEVIAQMEKDKSLFQPFIIARRAI